MAQIGFHCSHENHTPSDLLRYVQMAEDNGFEAAMCSDHFMPWRESGESGFAWSWLGAAMQATHFDFGMVCAPGQRYHPAIIAQAAATLGEMFPGRIWCALGSGQNLNEHITGGGWPAKPLRQQRLEECVQIIRALWMGETVTHRGLVTVDEAKIYTRPATAPRIYGAALSNESAAWVGGWADGIITTAKPAAEQGQFIDAFRRGGGAGKPMALQVLVAWDPDINRARQQAWERWRTNIHGARVQAELKTPADFDAVSSHVRPEDMDQMMRISTNLDDYVTWLQQDIDMGFERIYIFTAMRDQAPFIAAFGKHVLPHLKLNRATDGAQDGQPQGAPVVP
jgi:probable non-F420 flavinoid oxidoreductase